MCAVDALGIPSMLGKAATISSLDPVTGASIRVAAAAGGDCSWQPATAVVLIGAATADGCIAAKCCPVINFFSSHETAER